MKPSTSGRVRVASENNKYWIPARRVQRAVAGSGSGTQNHGNSNSAGIAGGPGRARTRPAACEVYGHHCDRRQRAWGPETPRGRSDERAPTTQAIDLRPSSPHRPRRIGAVHGPTYRQNDSIRARTHVLTRACGKTPEAGGNAQCVIADERAPRRFTILCVPVVCSRIDSRVVVTGLNTSVVSSGALTGQGQGRARPARTRVGYTPWMSWRYPESADLPQPCG